MSQHDVRRVAVTAICDPKTVYKYLRGMPQAGTIRERISQALTACGFGHLVARRQEQAPLAKTTSSPPSR